MWNICVCCAGEQRGSLRRQKEIDSIPTRPNEWSEKNVNEKSLLHLQYVSSVNICLLISSSGRDALISPLSLFSISCKQQHSTYQKGKLRKQTRRAREREKRKEIFHPSYQRHRAASSCSRVWSDTGKKLNCCRFIRTYGDERCLSSSCRTAENNFKRREEREMWRSCSAE